MKRQPEIQHARANADERNRRIPGIEVTIVMRGIKGAPMESHILTNGQALKLAIELLVALGGAS